MNVTKDGNLYNGLDTDYRLTCSVTNVTLDSVQPSASSCLDKYS